MMEFMANKTRDTFRRANDLTVEGELWFLMMEQVDVGNFRTWG